MNYQGYKCNLHGQNYQFFCQRCLQLVCRQCTIIGPHHTQIHSLTKISIAYQYRIQQIKKRIDNLVHNNREKIFKIIIQLNNNIQNIQIIKKSIDIQNNKQKQKLLNQLIKQYENNRNILQSYRENIFEKINIINDLGYKYQNIQNSFELLGSHNKIMEELKELHDRLQIFIEKDLNINHYTKQLTDIRVKLKEIEALNQLYQTKVKILNKVITKSQQLASQVPSRSLDYPQLLKELNKNMIEINHYVCNFCGVIFSFEQLNKECLKNKVNLNDLSANPSGQFCLVKPDVSKVGTQRHFFEHPINPAQFYNQQSQKNNSFKTQIQALILKIKTLQKIHGVSVQKQFNSNTQNQGYCQKIVFDYIFIEILGLTERQNQILSSLTTPKQQNRALLNYLRIIQKLAKINI